MQIHSMQLQLCKDMYSIPRVLIKNGSQLKYCHHRHKFNTKFNMVIKESEMFLSVQTQLINRSACYYLIYTRR